MAKIKLTKNELKKQKDDLKRFKRYLPTLQLKKQQLQVEIRQVEQKQEEKRAVQEQIKQSLDTWIAVFGEPVDLSALVQIDSVQTESGNIAGVDIPIFTGLTYKKISYDLFETPLWVDEGLEQFKSILAIDVEVEILNEQVKRLSDELRTTSQRVNLFEKVKIPEAQENIRTINIYLGDQQTAAVVRGKIAKNKVVKEVAE
ncbi:V-type ATP synthase subunit D [Spirochaeta cellobiosiphila]|uniref:V-type ATP synthase subunit D n=1 Tax=Spirochaeta cellobiosiphila TaxID=504483 RepID=UPI0004102190|nr:V-type ATP synthase subunit D [Spirochaeta cellobiosiphila]